MKTTEERIKALEAELQQLKQDIKPKFEVGKNYYFELPSSKMKWICNFKSIQDSVFNYNWYVILHDEFSSEESFKVNNWCSLGYYKRPATDKEVFEALKKEAIKRGFKDGVYIKGIVSGSTCYLKGDFEYLEKENVLWFGIGCDGYDLFKNGKWAEIIKDEPVKIGGYEVKKDREDTYSIGCKLITGTEIRQIKSFMKQNNFTKVAFDGIETDLTTINKILNL